MKINEIIIDTDMLEKRDRTELFAHKYLKNLYQYQQQNSNTQIFSQVATWIPTS